MGGEDRVEFQGTERFGILRRIGAGGMGVVYEAYDRERESLVALKTLRQASPETIFLFKQEFRSLAQTVHPKLVPLYEFISDGEQFFFTMELLQDAVDLRSFLCPDDIPPKAVGTPPRGSVLDSSFTEELTIDAPSGSTPGAASENTGGRDPGQAIDGPTVARAIDNDRVREIFGQLAEGVIALHEARILHRDLKPANVMVRKNGEVVLLDFGLVQELGMESRTDGGLPTSSHSGEKEPSHTSGRITGSVGYMAPEQAAAQSLTPASDWYAVGVMLFEVLTGRLPITGRSSDILYDKQRVDPVPPQNLVSGIPEDLAELCVELLNRDPDLRPEGPQILARLRGSNTPAAVTASATPTPAAIPFVGRHQHLEALDRCFEATSGGRVGVCRVHGRSGAGKSALVQHFLEVLAQRSDPVVLSGRCYEQESMPFKAVDSLIDDLTRYLLRLPPADVSGLLPDNIAALARVFPALRRIQRVERLVAKQDGGRNLEELRLQAFGALRELLTRIGELHPLVLFIDDLQWGDLDSAALLKEIIGSTTPPRLVMVFCYRTEYVGASACLGALEDLGGDETKLFESILEVEALTADETRELALALIGPETPEAQSQADWVVAESGGSALFIYELVQHLKAGMEYFEAGAVHLDEVLWRRVQRLPDQHRRLLEIVAVASRPIILRHVQEVAGFRALPPEVVGALRSDHLVRTTGPGLEDEVECYHDRIRESIVDHLPKTTVSAHHAALASALERDGNAKADLLAVHLEGAGQIERAGEFFRRAAEQAIEALAFDRAEDFYQRALAYAEDSSGKAEILEGLVHFYTDLARFDDAYTAGREGAALYGVKLPAKFHPPSFVIDLVRARLRVGRSEVAEILDLPTMSDSRRAGAVRLIAAAAKAAYQIRPELCVAINAKMVNLCLRHGNIADSAIGYMVFGSIFLGGILGNHRRGFEFGRLSLDLVERFKDSRQRAEVNFVVGYFGTSWLRPATEAEELWRTAYASGLETGDLFHTGCASCATILSQFMRGVSMTEILVKSHEYLELLDRVGQREPAGAVQAVRQAIRNLQGVTRGRNDFSDDEFDEATFVTTLPDYGSRHFAHYYFVVKMQTSYLWGEIDTALATLHAARAYLKDSTGMLHSAEHFFYEALILAASAGSEHAPNRRSTLKKLRKIHRRMRKWAHQCPHNFRHKERLVAGEIARLSDDRARAEHCYFEAHHAAAQSGYQHIEALAHQLSAGSLEQAEPAAAAEHLRAACDLWRSWGASAYADAIEDGIVAIEFHSKK